MSLSMMEQWLMPYVPKCANIIINSVIWVNTFCNIKINKYNFIMIKGVEHIRNMKPSVQSTTVCKRFKILS